jgi:LPS O-antigen subunit length determinant protein (WzzB/FepE family)
MTTNKNLKDDDEISLRELLITIWNGKFIIILILMISAVIGYYQNYKHSQKPNSFEISIDFGPSDNSEFMSFVYINKILKNKNLKEYIITEDIIFQKFIRNIKNYDLILATLKNNTAVKKKISKLPLIEQEKALFRYAKSFSLVRKKKDEPEYELKFIWHNSEEGLKIVDDLFNEALFNLKENIFYSLDNILKIVKRLNIEKDAERIDYLEGQSEIARELELNENKIESYEYLPSPYYLRGYKAIDKEISLIKQRIYRDEIYLLEEMNIIKNKIVVSWIDFNLLSARSKSLKDFSKSRIFPISIIIGLIIGIIFVFVLELFKSQKKRI